MTTATVDLLDFTAEDLYFDEASGPEVARLLEAAADAYGTPAAEQLLLRAYFKAPDDLSVLVGLYRFYYYQHRYPDALDVADRALRVVAERLGLVPDWRDLGAADLAQGVQRSMTLFRFYLYALKGAGYLKLRMGEPGEALARLEVIANLDPEDRIGVKPLIDLAHAALAEVAAAPALV